MSFYPSRRLTITTAILLSLLLIALYYGLNIMNSKYKTDLGNGVVIRADNYVHTGDWVSHCGRSRLVSRTPLPIPSAELKRSGVLTLGKMYALNNAEKTLAKEAIQAVIAMPEWYKNLKYRYSVLDENSNLNSHLFDLLAEHDGRVWALIIWQEIDQNEVSSFDITAQLYNPATFVDHGRALQAAAKSCSIPQ